MAATETQKKRYPYYIEDPLEHDRVRVFLDIFAAVLEHSSYGLVLDMYSRACMRCSRCADQCQVYQATNDPKDIPSYRTNILLRIYQRHFTLKGWMKSKLIGGSQLTDADIEEISSRKRMPSSATSIKPRLRFWAPVKAPAS